MVLHQFDGGQKERRTPKQDSYHMIPFVFLYSVCLTYYSVDNGPRNVCGTGKSVYASLNDSPLCNMQIIVRKEG